MFVVVCLMLAFSSTSGWTQSDGPTNVGLFDELVSFLDAGDKAHATLSHDIDVSESLSVADSFKTLSSSETIHVLNGRHRIQILIVTRARLTLSNVALTKSYGNAIRIEDSSRVEMIRCLLSANRGSTAVFVSRGSVLVATESTFVDNVASGRGGAIYVDALSSAICVGGLFTRNEAHRGGAVYIRKSTSAFTNVAFTRNKARDNGGALYVDDYSTTNVSSTTFSGNRAWRGSSIFVAEHGQSETINCTGLDDDSKQVAISFTHTATTTTTFLPSSSHPSSF